MDYDIQILNVYRSPVGDFPKFLIEFQSALDSLRAKKVVITGDFKIDMLENINSNIVGRVHMFTDTISMYSFSPHIDQATRICATRSSLLDNIFVNFKNSCVNPRVLDLGVSDHKAVAVNITCTSSLTPKATTSKKVRKYSEASVLQFQDALSLIDWRKLYNVSEVSKMYDFFILYLK